MSERSLRSEGGASVVLHDQTTGEPASVFAAGGVVIRDGALGSDLLLVKRPPPRDDWSVPKGKRDAGESDAECAVREVHEETGVTAEVVTELGLVRYLDHRQRTKQVRYFLMKPVYYGVATAGDDEIEGADWFPFEQALDRCTWPSDVVVVRAAVRAITHA